MGLRTSPWQSLRTMNMVLNSGTDSSFKYALSHMDDLLNFSGIVAQHLEHLNGCSPNSEQRTYISRHRSGKLVGRKFPLGACSLSQDRILPDPEERSCHCGSAYPNKRQTTPFFARTSWLVPPSHLRVWHHSSPLYPPLRKGQQFVWGSSISRPLRKFVLL